MGVDLSLLPFDCDHGTSFSFSHTLLELERRRELWDPIYSMETESGEPAPENFTSYRGDPGADGEHGYGKTTKTPYGDRIRFVSAFLLCKLKDHEAVRDNWKNRAIWAYLAELPPETKVALYWH